MEIHMIGHASLLVRTTNLSILMDPVLWDPHQEGLFDVNPKREVLHDKIPPYNLIILSHRHLDHFDIRSLTFLSKKVPVIIPRDPLLERYLSRMGFTQIKTIKDFTEITIGATTLFSTRSENNVPEYGIVFEDSSGVFWNQVDSVVASDTVQKVLSRFPYIDLLLMSWQPMLETSFQTNGGLRFPYSRYSEILYNLLLTSPKAVAPGANAFCYTGAAKWLNHIVFPVSRERFLHDVKTAAPHLASSVFPLDPADVMKIENHQCTMISAGSDFVRRTGFCQDVSFSPVCLEAELVDDNPDGIAETELEATVVEIVRREMSDYIEGTAGAFLLHRKLQVLYQLEVVLPSKKMTWNIDFSIPHATVREGANPLANVCTSITASSLHGMKSGTRGWDYAILGGYYRHFNKLYSVTTEGILTREWSGSIDPLRLLLPYQTISEKVLDQELELWSRHMEKAKIA